MNLVTGSSLVHEVHNARVMTRDTWKAEHFFLRFSLFLPNRLAKHKYKSIKYLVCGQVISNTNTRYLLRFRFVKMQCNLSIVEYMPP